MENQILDEGLIQNEIKLVSASKGKRFANYIIDYVISLLMIFLLSFTLYYIGILDTEAESTLLDNVLGIMAYVAYYTIIESALKGKSIGKLITKTRVVTIYGETPDFGTILKRSFSRLVPFEVFSFLGSSDDGWHDRWSETRVIDEKLSVLPVSNSLVV